MGFLSLLSRLLSSKLWQVLALVTVLSLYFGRGVVAIRVKGSISIDSNNKKASLHYLNRFGVAGGHSFYVYGNAASLSANNTNLVLGLVPQDIWDDLYRFTHQNSRKCREVFDHGGPLSGAKLANCSSSGDSDYIRTLPFCADDKCNQPPSSPVFDTFDFTFAVEKEEVQKTEFYYLFYLNCNNVANCFWAESALLKMSYNIYLVNNAPNQSNPYSNEFSYDMEGLLTVQLIFTLAYIFLTVVHFLLHCSCLRRKHQYSMHLLIKLFSASLVLEGAYVFSELIHLSVYAADGIGVVVIRYLGEVCNQVSDWFLILSVILVGKGWQVTTSSLRWSKVTVLIWSAYIIFSAIFFTWRVVSEQYYPLSTQLYHGYQSWAGGLYLAYRLFILVYILYEMRQVYLIENRQTALRLYVILAVCYTIWFLYLPLLTAVGVAINAVRREMVMTTVYLVFDILINIGMVILFCPLWSKRYFQFEHYINILTRSSNYRSLKSYGGDTPTPV